MPSVQCEHCDFVFTEFGENIGKEVACSKCGQFFTAVAIDPTTPPAISRPPTLLSRVRRGLSVIPWQAAVLFLGATILLHGCSEEPRPLRKLNFHELSVIVEVQNRRVDARAQRLRDVNEAIDATANLIAMYERIKDDTSAIDRTASERIDLEAEMQKEAGRVLEILQSRAVLLEQLEALYKSSRTRAATDIPKLIDNMGAMKSERGKAESELKDAQLRLDVTVKARDAAWAKAKPWW